MGRGRSRTFAPRRLVAHEANQTSGPDPSGEKKEPMKRTATCMMTFLVGASLTIAGFAADSPAAKPGPDAQASKDRVRKLFAAMREGKYRGDFSFPDLKWEDVPALLDLGGSKTLLKTFPRNSYSSQKQPECSEGMVALWLIEGLRLGKDPPLNALCLPIGPVKGDWGKLSEKNHPRVLQAYQSWWSKVRSLPHEKAAAVDPLEGSKLSWHGSPQRKSPLKR